MSAHCTSATFVRLAASSEVHSEADISRITDPATLMSTRPSLIALLKQRPLPAGAPAIAAYLKVKERRVYHWVTRSYIPTFKIGPLIAARRSELDEALRNRGTV